MRIAAAAAAIVFFSLSGTALAQDRDPPTDEEILRDRCGRTQAFLAMEYDLVMGGTTEIDLRNDRIAWLARLRPTERLTVDLGFGLSRTAMDLQGPNGLPMDARLEEPWQEFLEGRFRFLLYSHRHFDVSTYAELTMPVRRVDPAIESISFTGSLPLELTPDEANGVIALQHRWYRADFGLTLRGLLGRWRPILDIRYVHMPGRVDVSVDPSVRGILAALDALPDPTYDIGIKTMFYTIGLDIELGHGFTLETRAAAAPLDLSEHSWLFIFRAGIVMPMTPQPRRTWVEFHPRPRRARPPLRGG